MEGPIQVEVTRGGVVEAVHDVHAVAVADGRVVGSAGDAQLDVVRSLLAAAPATEDELETGPAPTPIEHNCSGKHAGFLAVCRTRGLETRGYRLRDHPL